MIRDATEADLPAVLGLDQANAPEVGSISGRRRGLLVKVALLGPLLVYA